MPLLPTLAVLLALGAPPAPPEGIAAHAFAWRRTSGGEWVLALTVEPRAGWHVYWQNPGDSGSAPTIELTLPAGWQAGEIVYPRPDVSVHEDEVLYGYESKAQYLVPVRRVPNPAAADPVAVPDAGRPAPWTARAKVMACKEQCVMAELSASGDAATGEGAELPRGLSGGVALGRALPETAERAGVVATLAPGRLVIEGPARGRDSVRFIPADIPGLQVTLPPAQAAVAGTVGAGRFRIEVPLAALGSDRDRAAVAGLVLLGNQAGDPCVWLSISHAAGPAESAAPGPAK